MLTVLVPVLPFIVFAYFLYFRNNYQSNHLMVMLIFLSFMIFATNYTDYGLDIHIYRFIHKGIGILLILALMYHIYTKGIFVLKNITTLFLGLFFTIILLSFLGNDIYMLHYQHYVINFIFLSSIVLFLYLKIDNREKLDELLKFILYLSLILAVFAIIETFLSGKRAILVYSNPNYLAYSLMLGFPIALFREHKYKILNVSLLTYAIFLSGSRAVELPIVLLFGLFIVVHFNKFNKKYLLMFLCVVILVFGLFSRKIINNDSPTAGNVRIELAYLGFNAFKDSPINGIGYSQFRTKFINYVDETIRNTSEFQMKGLIMSYDKSLSDKDLKERDLKRNMEMMTHSDFVKIYAELGLLGIVFLLLYFYKLYFELKKLFVYQQEYFYVSISLIFSSLTFSMFHNNITTFVFWFILFLPFLMNKIFQNNSQKISYEKT